MKILSAFTLGIVLSLSACTQQTTEQKIAEARESLDNGEYQTAAVVLKGVVSEFPSQPAARELLGQSYLFLGDAALAVKELTSALNAGAPPENVLPYLLPAYKQLKQHAEIGDLAKYDSELDAALRSKLNAYRVYALLSQGKLEEAKTLYANIKVDDRERPYNLLAEAYLKVAENELGEARKITTNILTVAPQAPEANSLEGHVYQQIGDFKAAASSYKAYLNAYPNNNDAKLELASALIRAGETEQAERITDQLIKLFPNQPLVNQIKAMARYESGDNESAKKHIESAINYGFDTPFNRVLAGVASFRLQNYEQAYTHFQQASGALPSNQNVKRLMALTQTILGNNSEAATTYSELDALSENDLSFLTSNIYELVSVGEKAQASSMLRLLEQSENQTPSMLMKKGILKLSLDDMSGINDLRDALDQNASLENGRQALIMGHLAANDAESALRELDSYLETENKNEAVLNFAAGVHMQLGNEDKARNLYQKALSLDSKNVGALMGLSRLAKSSKNTALEFEYLTKVLEDDPTFTPAILRISFLDKSISQDKKKIAHRFLENAHQSKPENTLIAIVYATRQNELQKPEKAIEALSGIEKVSSLPNSYWIVYSDALVMNNDAPKAIEVLREWTETSPNNSNAYYRLIVALDTVKGYERASQVANKAMKAVEPKSLFRLLYAYFEMRQNNLQSAIESLKLVEEPFASLPMAKGIKGIDKLAKGDVNTALPLLSAFHSAYNYSLSMEVYAYALKSAGQYARAKTMLSDYLEENPDDQKIRTLYASLLSESDSQLAKQQYQILIQKNENNVFALNNLATLYIEEQEYTSAIALAQRALDKQPDSAAVQDTLGLALLRNGETKKAMYFLSQAYNNSDSDNSIWVNYAEGLLQAGKPEAAKKILLKVESSDSKLNTRVEKLMSEF